jgi:orotate phosphoribosyltransferase-like protein
MDDYITYLKAIGRYTELAADLRGLGWKPQEIADELKTSRQNVDRMLLSHTARLQHQADQAQFLKKGKVGRPRKEK